MTEVLDEGKYLERKTSDIWAHVLIVPGSKYLSQFPALSPKEKEKTLRLMASGSTPLILIVEHVLREHIQESGFQLEVLYCDIRHHVA
jgi:hypothetical protein